MLDVPAGASASLPGTNACSADGGVLVCPALDVTTQCPGGSGVECQPTWSDVLAHPACTGSFSVPDCIASDDQRWDCGAYHVRSIRCFELLEGFEPATWDETYYYNASTGALIAEFDSPTNCGGGPPAGIDVNCLPSETGGPPSGTSPAVTDVCPTDAGSKD